MDHVLLVNIYTPTGSYSRLEREVFFNNEVIYFLQGPLDITFLEGILIVLRII